MFSRSPQSPRQWFRIENAAAEVADVYIFDEIGYWGITAADFVRDLVAISAPKINLHLNTPGGDVFDGIAIYSSLKAHPATIAAYIPGLAASIGTVIAMGADTITIAPHARMMIHDAWAVAMGDANDFANMAKRLEATSANIASIYAERSGDASKGVDYWRGLMKAESWFTDQEAVDAGLADQVGLPDQAALKQAAVFDLSSFRHGERIAASLRAEAGATVACPECTARAAKAEPPTPAPVTRTPKDELEDAIARVRLPQPIGAR